MKNKIFYALVFLSGVICMGSTAAASTDQRRSMIQSKGIINYAGKVIIDSSDVTNLADQTDDLEISYKKALTDSLAQIGSYVRADGSMEHDKKEEIDPQQIRYSDLTAGILNSQSVAYLSDTQAADLTGYVYYAQSPNNILEVTNDNTGMPVYIMPGRKIT